jgi:uncharacterized membrane protein YjfL (UPF0719 family)
MNNSLHHVFGVCVAVSLILTAGALHLWGAAEVRADSSEMLFLTFIGAIWIALANKLFPWLVLSLQDDVVERRNRAALIALCGAVFAVATIYVGGSLGKGSSYFENFFSAGLGMVCFLLLWILFELGAKASMSITEDRDVASGIRLCGFLVAIGLVLGRALAGDWHSETATIQDLFHDGWPVTVVWAMGLVIEIFARPTRHCPFPSWPTRGLVPALLYLLLAVAWLWHLGPWEGMP